MATLLGVPSTTTLDNWRKKAPETLSPDTLERVSYLLHIYRSLQQLLGADEDGRWIRQPNTGDPFDGLAPLEYMLQGQVRHLLDTHRYLKGVVPGAFWARTLPRGSCEVDAGDAHPALAPSGT